MRNSIKRNLKKSNREYIKNIVSKIDFQDKEKRIYNVLFGLFFPVLSLISAVLYGVFDVFFFGVALGS